MRTRASRRVLSCLAALTVAVAVCVAGLVVVPIAAEAAVSYSSEELAFLGLINQYRQANGLGTLMLSDVISDASDKHNLDMGHYGFFDHTTRGSDYFAVSSSPWDRMAACGYDYNTAMGENIAAGYATAEAVFQGWKNSPGHDANMLNPSFKVIGISLEVVQGSPYTSYWTTDLGGFVDPSAHDPGGPSTTTTTRPPPTTTTAVTTTTTRPPTTTTTRPPTTTTTVAAPVFTDVQPQDRFYREISTLAAASVIGGYADNSFRPDNQVTRAQFAKIIMLAVGRHTGAVEGTADPTFPDVTYEGDPYPFDFVEEAVALGVIKGNQDGTFGPYDYITRAQLALMLVRAGGGALDTPPAGYRLPFGDVPGYAKEAVAVACYNRLVSGKTDTTFDPYGFATRGQVAKMIYSLLERMRD